MKRLPTALPRQQGTSLLVAMVALVAMMTAGMALIRSVDSANLAAGNFQLQQSAEQNIDMAISEAMLAYMQAPGSVAMTDRNNNQAVASYSAVRPTVGQPLEGIPKVLLDLAAPAWDANGPVGTNWPGERIDLSSKQLRRYYVERLCANTGVASNTNCQMYTMEYHSDSISNTGASNADELPYIRITVRVDGPKGTTSYAQMFMKGE
jgi:type IV pilus assembly protein PilX